VAEGEKIKAAYLDDGLSIETMIQNTLNEKFKSTYEKAS